jgi:hypothetical protein
MSAARLSFLFFVRIVLPGRTKDGTPKTWHDRSPKHISRSAQKALALHSFMVQNVLSQRGVTHRDASLDLAEIGR